MTEHTWFGVMLFAFLGVAAFGPRGAIPGAIAGFFVSRYL